MNKNIFSSIFFVISLAFLAGNCQSNSSPAQKKSDIPSIEILSLDSASIFNTNTVSNKKPVVLVFFNTTCDHCQKEAIDLVKNKTELKKIQLVMMSSENLTAINNFYNQYGLSAIDNLMIGKDFLNTGAKFYKFESVPFCAVYTKYHEYIDSFERDFNTQMILEKLRNKGKL